MSKLPAKIWAIHGFLGLPSDWENFDVMPVEIEKAASLTDWAKKFNARIAVEGAGFRNYLLGYSMGGRLALHALVDQPELWEGAILVSTNRGIKEGKQERIESDEVWAERFEKDPWYQVVADWMAQPAFKDSKGPLRLESDFDRVQLGEQLRNFSLGRQEILNSNKAHWVVGEKDISYREMQPHAIVVPNAGHRVIFDNPKRLNEIIAQIIPDSSILG